MKKKYFLSDEQRSQLDSVVNILRSHNYGHVQSSRGRRPERFKTGRLQSEGANWVADAIERCLRGEEVSLDEALGIKRGVGAPRKSQLSNEHRDIVRKIAHLRGANPPVPWAKITNRAVEEKWAVTDERTLKRLYDAKNASDALLAIQPIKTAEISERRRWRRVSKEKIKDW